MIILKLPHFLCHMMSDILSSHSFIWAVLHFEKTKTKKREKNWKDVCWCFSNIYLKTVGEKNESLLRSVKVLHLCKGGGMVNTSAGYWGLHGLNSATNSHFLLIPTSTLLCSVLVICFYNRVPPDMHAGVKVMQPNIRMSRWYLLIALWLSFPPLLAFNSG